METQKRCLYEILGLHQTCTQDEIRAAYKKLALQRHPDKLVQSGLSAEEATASFQELVHAYEVLSDPKERQWYDSHRSQILFCNPSDSDSLSPIPNLFSYFSTSCYTDYTNPKTGFFMVYSDVFNKIYANEINYAKKLGLNLEVVKESPVMGDLNSPYSQANAFYGYWLVFSTVMDFVWVDKWDAAAGINRKSRRVMEEENKKLRRKAKKEYNEMVRRLAEFVKKRDKRVIDMMVMKEKEREKKKEEERERRREREREKLDRARLYEEQQWARIEEVEGFEGIEEGDTVDEGEERKEWYCMACGKKFKSQKQWKNHEQSKKHKERVSELRDSFADEDIAEADVVGSEVETKQDLEGASENDSNAGHNGFVSAEVSGSELEERFKENFMLEEQSGYEDGIGDVEKLNGVEKSVGSDDENDILEAMLLGHKSRAHVASHYQPKASSRNVHVDNYGEEEFMQYNSWKDNRKSRRVNKEKCKNFYGESMQASDEVANVPSQENNQQDGSDSAAGGMTDGRNSKMLRNNKAENQAVERKGNTKSDTIANTKNLSKGTKQKVKLKNSASVCEKCGEEFESRNRLHKHLTETGHAMLKSR
ncbi:hypothetical protein Nepgr_018856 [Nepenthes gracilis]|uniref:Uncharacterized protein n=1 Tax=Nepenthes gracilis TaxID=150966 RepID=A0AAD3SS87_NEPGR|nr:hypothetical protein Nepgr_018856 [Nepenthes gracilis]